MSMKAEDWIKVSDRVPENSDLVVACFIVLRGHISPMFDLARYIDGRWRCNGLKGLEPTHWMPIIRPQDC